MLRRLCCFLVLCPLIIWASEIQHPILPPSTFINLKGNVDQLDDVYSADLNLSIEYALFNMFSLYSDAAFRFLGYGFEYSKEGYVHNYCNYHMNGFNETYLGAKIMIGDVFGINANWRFPPGNGAQENRFHRFNIEPFFTFAFSDSLKIGGAIRYNKFLEQDHLQPGDELGAKISFYARAFWYDVEQTGWVYTGSLLYQVRFMESENHNMAKDYQKMDDRYQGLKFDINCTRYFALFPIPLGFGFDYQIHIGNLFGAEMGQQFGIHLSTLPF